jgi:hypothetical protein
MESGGSIMHSEEPATVPYPDPDEASPCHHTLLTVILMLSSHLYLGLPSGLFMIDDQYDVINFIFSVSLLQFQIG